MPESKNDKVPDYNKGHTMLIDEQSLRQITIDVCQSMLGLELTSLDSDKDGADRMVASVEIRGCTHSVLEVFAHDNLMAAIAEVMFSSDRGSLSESDIQDAFGEIANMIGGNVKGGYGHDADLSLPIVGQARHWLSQMPPGSLRTEFTCCEYPLVVILRDVIPTPTETKAVMLAE